MAPAHFADGEMFYSATVHAELRRSYAWTAILR